jgi:hypothetical protein
MGGSGGPSGGLPVGFNYSVYLLLTGFFVVLGLVLRMIVKAVRQTQPGPQGFPVRVAVGGSQVATAAAATSRRS